MGSCHSKLQVDKQFSSALGQIAAMSADKGISSAHPSVRPGRLFFITAERRKGLDDHVKLQPNRKEIEAALADVHVRYIILFMAKTGTSKCRNHLPPSSPFLYPSRRRAG